LLKAAEGQKRKKISRVKRVTGGVESAIKGDRAGGEAFFQGLMGDLIKNSSVLQVGEQRCHGPILSDAEASIKVEYSNRKEGSGAFLFSSDLIEWRRIWKNAGF
jgi:hypothetical protein